MIINCYFCNKEFNQEWTSPVGGIPSLPMFFECKEHSPGISFHRQDRFVMEYKGRVFVAELEKATLEMVAYRPKKQSMLLFPLPETRDLKEFTEYLDRALRLQAFA